MFYPYIKVTTYPSRPELQKVIFTAGAVPFYLRVQTCNFSAYSVRSYVFQQLLHTTYALTPYALKVMVQGFLNAQYQDYGKKSLYYKLRNLEIKEYPDHSRYMERICDISN
jgi:hypothetical protein